MAMDGQGRACLEGLRRWGQEAGVCCLDIQNLILLTKFVVFIIMTVESYLCNG
ncbi:hypothetical protein S1OALGB6SA_1570 [Olavius algarvensis spirochete endosymbiont]|nr:hypothetical protein S1OALGB6SA_1570 [Olavius algarvensis spirochete endosymbiont]